MVVICRFHFDLSTAAGFVYVCNEVVGYDEFDNGQLQLKNIAESRLRRDRDLTNDGID